MIRIADEVAAALAAGRPVVALESTLVAHGLPFPQNLETARALEAAVRTGGAIPATIAVVDGEARIGLDDATLERLARGGREFVKAGAADLAVAIARGSSAATTVSGTALLAHRAGIAVFATGGLGGVHRGDDDDVSHDLVALAELPILVVCAGAKAFLDLPRTVERLESLGVLLLGWRTRELPAFYSRESGIALEHRVDSADEVARMLRARFGLLGQGGVLLACPIPDAAAVAPDFVADFVADAETAAAGVSGKARSPAILAKLARRPELLHANRALAVENARVATEVAVAYAALPA
ncbi:MAG: pseudouridine-5'-phosphate glycosidase [Myxococcales bacterium]|nr:pseudouridine-5'-phosphate glycosidase [Myxococcales bacterium]